MNPIASLRKDLDAAIRRGHPWIFADALALPDGLRSGQAVDVHDDRGRFLARGLFEADHPIAVRVWTRDAAEAIDADMVGRRVKAAAALRRAVVPPGTDAYRLIHGEADGMPGIVVDRYGDAAVMKADSAAVAALIDPLGAALFRQWPELRHLLERAGRGHGRDHSAGEPVPSASGGARPPAALVARVGSLPEGALHVQEHGMILEADPAAGQKTGLYLDQRENRRRLRALAAGRTVLNLYSYSGGFSVAAALGGARQVLSVDQAAGAIAALRRNLAHNGLDPQSPAYPAVVGEVIAHLESHEELWDLIVADPPNMAPSAAARNAALATYRRLNLLCLRRLRPGGILLTCSCSSHVGAEDLRRVLAEAAASAGRRLRIFAQHGAGPDHPLLPGFPEGDYLTALFCMVE